MLQRVADRGTRHRSVLRGIFQMDGFPLLKYLLLSILALVVLAGCSSKPFSASTTASSQGAPQRERPQPEPFTVAQQARYDEAEAAVHSDNPEKAIAILETLRNERPHVANVSARLGLLYQQMDRASQAMAAYRRALSDDPGQPLALNNLALLYQQKGRFDEARELLESGLEWHPAAPSMHYNLAVLAELYLLDLPLALTHYRRYQSLAAEPKKAVAGWIKDLERRVN
jgi:tetratricopeptide (TPR) repeat protein